MIASVVFAGDYDSASNKMTYTVYKGWNLVPTWQSSSDQTCPANYVFWYLPSTKSYFGMKPGTEVYYPNENALNTFRSEHGYVNVDGIAYQGLNGLGSVIWTYSSADCTTTLQYNTGVQFSGVNENFLGKHPLKAGWNFISVAPWMLEKNLKDILKNCSVIGFNSWKSDSQTWEFASSSGAASQISQSTGILRTGDVGKTFLIKVASDCYLSLGENPVNPPALPN